MKRHSFPQVCTGEALRNSANEPDVHIANGLLITAKSVHSRHKAQSIGRTSCSCGINPLVTVYCAVFYEASGRPLEIVFSSLLPHIVAFHRHELTEEDLEMIERLRRSDIEEIKPAALDLHPPRLFAPLAG